MALSTGRRPICAILFYDTVLRRVQEMRASYNNRLLSLYPILLSLYPIYSTSDTFSFSPGRKNKTHELLLLRTACDS